MKHNTSLALLALMMTISGFACDADEPRDAAVEPSAQLIYTLRLDSEGVEPADEPTAAWKIKTNLGYEVQLKTMYVSSYSAELLACEQQAQPSLMAWLQDLELISSAWAGHGEVAAEASTTRGVLEAWHKRESPIDFEVRQVTRLDYCKLHYLLARNDDRFELPDLALARLTVKVEGTWRLGSQAAQPFSVESAINNGKIFTLEQSSSDEPKPFNAAVMELRITRRLATAFDDIELERATEDDIARGLLTNIIKDTSVELITP